MRGQTGAQTENRQTQDEREEKTRDERVPSTSGSSNDV